MQSSSKNFSSRFTIAICFAIVFLFYTQSVPACSWDYLIWQNRQENADPYYRFIKNGYAGFIDRNGKVVIKPTLFAYGNHQDGIVNGLIKTDSNKYIDIRTGKEVSEDFYYQQTEVIHKLTAKKFWDDSFGFVDPQGNTIIEPKFVYAEEFKEGLAPVVVDGPCFYNSSTAVCSDTEFFPIGTKTQPTKACQFNFVDEKGKFISSQTYLEVKQFSEGLAPVKTKDGWGYIAKDGKLVIKPQFEKAEPFSEGLAKVKNDGSYGYIDRKGKLVIKLKFNVVTNFSNGLAAVGYYADKMVDNEFYFIDKKCLNIYS